LSVEKDGETTSLSVSSDSQCDSSFFFSSFFDQMVESRRALRFPFLLRSERTEDALFSLVSRPQSAYLNQSFCSFSPLFFPFFPRGPNRLRGSSSSFSSIDIVRTERTILALFPFLITVFFSLSSRFSALFFPPLRLQTRKN